MKEVMEEYGMAMIVIAMIMVVIGVIPKLRCIYLVGAEIFLNSIGG